MRTTTVSKGYIARVVLAGIGAVGLVSGCSLSVDGNAEPEGGSTATTTVDGERSVKYNPCTDLSDEALRATRVDPASKHVVTDAAAGPASHRICQWASTEGPYFFTVAATYYTLADSRTNEKFTGFREVQMGPRSGLTYQSTSDEYQLRCYASVPYAEGMFEMNVAWQYGQRASKPPGPPCDIAIQHAKDIESYLPK